MNKENNKCSTCIYTDCLCVPEDYKKDENGDCCNYKYFMVELERIKKENDSQWHEIKCCSQDLPPVSEKDTSRSVFVANEFGEPIYYDYNDDEWCDINDNYISDENHWWHELPRK